MELSFRQEGDRLFSHHATEIGQAGLHGSGELHGEVPFQLCDGHCVENDPGGPACKIKGVDQILEADIVCRKGAWKIIRKPGCETRDAARRFAIHGGIYQKHDRGALHRLQEIEAAGPSIQQPDAIGEIHPGELFQGVHPDSLVAHENIPDTEYENPSGGRIAQGPEGRERINGSCETGLVHHFLGSEGS